MHKPMPKQKKIPKKKETPKPYHHEDHHEEWSSWHTYDHQDGTKKDHQDYQDIPKGYTGYGQTGYQRYRPSNAYQKDTYFPQQDHNEHIRDNGERNQGIQGSHGNDGIIGYSYPPQYAIHEDVKEVPNNDIEPYRSSYEEGYRKGLHSETGYIYTDKLNKFLDDKQEESDNVGEEHEKEDEEKTHAGRYLVDEDEWQNEQDSKTEGSNKRFSNKILIRV